MGLIGTLILRRPSAPADEAKESPHSESLPQLAGPPLLLLVPTVAGVSSYQLHSFPDGQSAADFISTLMTSYLRSRVHAFWAFQQETQFQPDERGRTRTEALVMIREGRGSDIVYPVSFIDIESALAFVRFELERGQDPSLVSVYWAACARVDEGSEGVSVHPASAPVPWWGAKQPAASPIPAATIDPAAETKQRNQFISEIDEALETYRREESQRADLIQRVPDAPTAVSEAPPEAEPATAEPDGPAPASAILLAGHEETFQAPPLIDESAVAPPEPEQRWSAQPAVAPPEPEQLLSVPPVIEPAFALPEPWRLLSEEPVTAEPAVALPEPEQRWSPEPVTDEPAVA